MRLFPTKKPRTARAASLRPSTTGRLSQRLSDRDVLLRLLLCLAAVVALLFVVQGWKAPFPYRLGDHAPGGIVASRSFERVNEFKTERAQLQQEAQVAPIYNHQPSLIRALPHQLREDLIEAAAVGGLEELSAETRAAFGLTSSDNSPSAKQALREHWQLLREGLRLGAAPQQQIDELTGEFTRFIEPLRELGVADFEDLSHVDLGDPITIRSEDRPDGGRTTPAANVILGEMLKSTGLLGAEWEAFPKLAALQPVLERWLLNQTPTTLTYDDKRTRAARSAAREQSPPVTDAYERGDLLVAPGQAINEEALEILRSQYEASQRDASLVERVLRVVTTVLMLLVLAGINGYYIVRNERELVRSVKRLGLYLLAIVLAVGFGRLLSFDPWRAEIIPVLCIVMVCAVAYNQIFASLTAFTLTLILTLSTGMGLTQFVVLMSALASAVVPLTHVPSRSTLVKVGFLSAGVYLIVSWGIGVIEASSIERIWTDSTLLINSLRGAGWCLAAGYLVAGSLPFIESTFDVVTDISLLELSDVSHPLLQELVRRAPGTYNHSITVATIAETAADAIGANGLLCRVGAYFHDIGKMLKPQYFVENMTAGDESRHRRLAPAMSTLIIIGHVKDGVDLARQQGLPEPLIDFIEQHHGTTLVEYFYHEATKHLQPDHPTDAEESSFRYPGPKPQSAETGVLMLADAVEGASRALSEPTPKRIETLVHEITLKRLLDGQFDESSLTLGQLRAIEESLTKSLTGIYHGRIKYPEQRTA